MLKIITRGDSVYQCTICSRKTRVPTNKLGLDIVHYCTITNGCKGKLTKVTLIKDIINTPSITPSVIGLQNWFQHKLIYTHTQTNKSRKWIITHNLNNNPIVHTFTNQLNNDSITTLTSDNNNIIKPIDLNSISISFESPQSGIAQLLSPASQLIPRFQPTPNTDYIQYSNNNCNLTIATKNNDDKISITLKFINPNKKSNIIQYDIDNIPSLSSPWAGNNKIIFNNTTYTIRNIPITTTQYAANLLINKQIVSGASVMVDKVGGIGVGSNEVMILGSVYPYMTVDRVYDRWVDFGMELSDNIVYMNGQILVSPKIEQSVYPLLRVV